MEYIHLILPILVFVAVVSIGAAVALSRHRQNALQRLSDRVGATDAVTGTTVLSPTPQGHLDFLRRLGQPLALSGVSLRLRRELAGAGYTGERAVMIYYGAKLALLVSAILTVLAVVTVLQVPYLPALTLILCAGGLAFLLPNAYLRMQRYKRRKQIEQHLPDAVDLLEVCVSAGMGLDQAWNSVTEEMRPVSTVLADEMTLANLEVQLGTTRAVAMRRMAERTGVEEVSSLVAMFVQTERFGTSIREMLRSFAAAMRENRSHQSEDAAEKMAVKLLFPMVLFIFPVTLIITVGPAAVGIVRMIMEN